MKVRITKEPTSKLSWYSGRVGELFEVKRKQPDNRYWYLVKRRSFPKEHKNSCGLYILADDCKIDDPLTLSGKDMLAHSAETFGDADEVVETGNKVEGLAEEFKATVTMDENMRTAYPYANKLLVVPLDGWNAVKVETRMGWLTIETTEAGFVVRGA